MIELRKRLNDLDAKYDRFARRTSRILFGIFVVLLVSGVLNIHLLGQNNDRIHDIQQSRRDTILATCREVNHRNAQAYIFLKALPANPGQPKRSETEQNRLIHGFTDALVGPVRDCKKRAAELTK